MKIINKRVTIVTNLILVGIIFVVGVISFFPEHILPIYGKNVQGAIYRGNEENNCVSLMFNVYENTEIVNSIVDVLDEHGVKATFFVGGCWADDNGETLNKIKNSGHEIGNHGYFHKDHKKLSYQDNASEITNTTTVVNALCGAKVTLFAPPSGSFSDVTLKAAQDLGYKVIMWSKDTIDWRDSDIKTIIARATKKPNNGDLILMHPKEHTLSALSDIIGFYKEQGFNLVSVSDNVK
ncbi:MAG: polysaccharide deacetylase family protein [Clostridia bacterium]|nr:polysaccharide deacetylase family protein [Clostridia bacterium]